MATCIECAVEIDPSDPPRYDVLSDGFDPDDPNDRRGPYCADHFKGTQTYSRMLAPESVDAAEPDLGHLMP